MMTFLNGFTPTAGQSFHLFDSTTPGVSTFSVFTDPGYTGWFNYSTGVVTFALPEAGTLGVLAVGTLGLLRLRRKKRINH